MKIKEINKLSIDELKKKVNLLKKDLFNLRFRKVNGQLDNSANISSTKRDLAKIFTTLNNKEKKWAKKF